MDSNGVNGPLAMLTSFAGAGASFGGILFSLLAAILVPVLGKAVDGLIKTWIAERGNRWKQRALDAEARVKALEAATRRSGS